VIFSKPYEILSMKYLWPSTINTQNIFFKFYYLTELLGFFDLSSISIYNLPKVDFLYVFVWKQSYIEINLGYFYFLPQGRYFLLYMYNFCIKGHLLIYGYIKVWPVVQLTHKIFFSNFIIWLNYEGFLIYPVFQYIMKQKQWILQYFNLQYILHSIKCIWKKYFVC
jgi:hypothetical protein